MIDKKLEDYVKCSENCRRRVLLSSICGSLQIDNRLVNGCCDVCSPAVTLSSRLDVLQPIVTRQKRRRVVRSVSDELKENLMSVREEVYKEMPSFRMVGISFFCPESTIDKLCREAKFIKTEEDLSQFGIRSVLKDKFFNVITDSSSCAHASQRRRTVA